MRISSVRKVAEEFLVGGPIAQVHRQGRGLVNDTFLITTLGAEPRRTILQRINRRVFPRPELIMLNLRTVLDHARAYGRSADTPGATIRLPDIVKTRHGLDHYIDNERGFWRAFGFIDRTRVIERIDNLTQAAQLGLALGRFHRSLGDLDPARLHDTLPGFHVTPTYLAKYHTVRRRQQSRAESPELRYCTEFVVRRAPIAGVLERARREGRLRVRVIHGDPKLDNVLFDEDTDTAVCIIDLDTVKAGLIHYDIGDCLRSCCNPAGELAPEPRNVVFEIDVCRAVLQGYFAEAEPFLKRSEYVHLYDAIRLIPFELGLRFLTDHLGGDQYFKVASRGENLYRAVVQFHLAADIERREKQIRKLIDELAG